MDNFNMVRIDDDDNYRRYADEEELAESGFEYVDDAEVEADFAYGDDEDDM